MKDIYFLKSKRLGFRTWTLDDIELAVELWGDATVSQYIGGPFTIPQIYSKLLTERSILRRHNVQCWPCFNVRTGEFIGCCGLRPYELHKNTYEIEVYIKSACWNKGYALEATKEVIKFAFGVLRMESLFAHHHPQNEACKTILQKLGFQYSHEEEYKPTGLSHAGYVLKKPA